MARNYAEESEFGLGVLPNTSGAPIAEGVHGIPALTDADAIAAGAVGQEAGPVGSVQQLGHELREIYATPDTFGTSDPSTAAGTS